MKTPIVRSINVDICPREAAQIFAEFDSVQMAYFFNEVARYINNHYQNTWGSFVMQMQYVTDDPSLTLDARHIMRIIGEYSEKQHNSDESPS
jgi:hypothetical protein